MDDTLKIILIVAAVYLLLNNKKGATQVSNAETWTWTDYKGQQRSITVHRDVSAS